MMDNETAKHINELDELITKQSTKLLLLENRVEVLEEKSKLQDRNIKSINTVLDIHNTLLENISSMLHLNIK